MARRWAESAKLPAGALLGVASFFLPCGFTQSMQFQALAAGSFASGAHGLLTRSAGFLVFGLGLYQAWNLLTALGIAPIL